ncbi:hypothetical protein QVD17_17076 [Tagetes erecta]|uniref:Uncharacterized protein n=1 Tax=Tagetes erecta TaxID=13708 RepID=A0AAD8KW14_TARER|nr:hypothetical protein QVD17_17076 [Tagetes erecta]
MAKNQTTQNPSRRMSSYEKIRKATFGSFRRVDPSMSSEPRVSYTQPIALQRPMLDEVPIEYVPPLNPKTVKNVRFSSKNVVKNDDFIGGKELVEQKTFGESRFDSFIGRMKMKMNAPSNVGVVKTVNRHDTFDDKVSIFIGKTKLKFQATFSMGANEK